MPYLSMNQQFLMATGQQLLSNPVTAAAIDAYGKTLMNRGQGWVDSVRVYFDVDTNYVVKKFMLIFLPFFHNVSNQKRFV